MGTGDNFVRCIKVRKARAGMSKPLLPHDETDDSPRVWLKSGVVLETLNRFEEERKLWLKRSIESESDKAPMKVNY